MFIVIQFPFADVRNFLDFKTRRLSSPSWPLPESDKEFVRSSGVIKRRIRGGIDSWCGEDQYCNARRAMRFYPFLRKYSLGSFGKSLYLDCKFRRFLFDGNITSRFEIGFTAHENDTIVFPFKKNEPLKFINAVLSIPVRIKNKKKKFESFELIKSGSYLASHFLRSSTRNSKTFFSSSPKEWWISHGSPLVLVEYEADEISQLPGYCISLEHETFPPNILHHCRKEKSGIGYSVWFFCRQKSDKDLLRRLRLHLFRLHAERENLKQTLRLIIRDKIKQKKRTESSDRLQKYLRDSMRLLCREYFYGLPQSEILKMAYELDDIVNFGQRATLLNKLSDIRKNIFNCITKITDPIIEEKLKRLSNAINKMSEHLPVEVAEAVSQNLDDFVSEVLSSQPRTGRYKAKGKNLIDIAKTLADLGSPVIEIIKSLIT
jgi:hypothetical protein